MLRHLIAVLCLMTLANPAVAAKRAFEIADYYRSAFVSGPELSPDGGRIVVSVRRYELAEGESWSELWMMDGHGSRPRQLTFGRHNEGSQAFSPDGRQLVFSSDRSGDSQLWMMPVDGGEARQLTDFPLPLAMPVWSPDGRWIAVSARVYPECGADAECNGTLHDSRTGGPLRARVTDELLYRHWDHWREDRWSHVLLVDAATGEVVRDLTPGRWDSPPFSPRGGPDYGFSPDSTELVFVSNHDPVPATSTNADLWLVPVAGGPARNLTAANRGWDGHAVFSPDGRQIAFLSQATPSYESDLYRIGLYDRDDGSIRYLTDRSSFDNWISALEWLPDGKSLLFEATVKGRTPLFRIALRSGRISEVVTDGAIAGWRPTPDGEAVIYTRSRVGEPQELYRVATAGGEPARISNFNSELSSEVDIRPAEELWVKGAGDYQVQIFVVKPHDFDPTRTYPLILNVHGGPQSPWLDRYRGDWQVYPGSGYVVAFPNPTGSAGFGQEFVDAIACDYGGRVYQDLMKVTDALAAIPWVDEERMGAMGWSWGGYMMMWFEGHTDRFIATAAMMGVYDYRSKYGATEELWFPEHDLCGRPWNSEHYARWSPSNFVENFETPCMVITGERDYRVPYTQSLQFFTDLQVQGVPSRMVVFPDAGHWPSWYEMAFYYLAHLDWFHQWLGGAPPPWDLERFLNNQVFGDTLPQPSAPAVAGP